MDALDPLLVEPLSEAEWLAMVDDPDWVEATAARGDASASRDADCSRVDTQQAIDIDAVLGQPLTGYAETALTAAAERAAQQRRTHEVTLVTIVSELTVRGVDTPDGLSRTDWLRHHDASLTAGQARALVTVGAALADPRWARLRVHVTTQQVTVGNAAQIIDFHARTAPVADPDDLATAVGDLLDQARQLRPEELARLVRHHTEQIKPPRDEDALDNGRRNARGLWFTPPNATGMVGMRGVLDPEGAAIIKSAIDPLCLPRPEKDKHGHTTAPDDRTPAHRRMDALLAMLQRAVASGDGVPTTDKAKVVVLIDLDTLLTDLGDDIPDAFRRKHPTSDSPDTRSGSCRTATWPGTGTGTGITLSGDVLSPGVVRRMACDAQIIPLVLGGDSKPLDVARRKRLFTRSQRLALAVRDKGCTWQGCTMPPSWCDAHHVTHWASGGPTNLLNAALLCPRHHTAVHDRILNATVTDTGVTWHT
ncbi:HNH endonuclease signature motif containing protein [Humibacillus xanthopallidus]